MKLESRKLYGLDLIDDRFHASLLRLRIARLSQVGVITVRGLCRGICCGFSLLARIGFTTRSGRDCCQNLHHLFTHHIRSASGFCEFGVGLSGEAGSLFSSFLKLAHRFPEFMCINGSIAVRVKVLEDTRRLLVRDLHAKLFYTFGEVGLVDQALLPFVRAPRVQDPGRRLRALSQQHFRQLGLGRDLLPDFFQPPLQLNHLRLSHQCRCDHCGAVSKICSSLFPRVGRFLL
mmetsp:Transcript_11635/g.28759  ORF Transcript_11635/g.28759 Transcript_11635/m.28759 type:complete len:232 (+) Transcript_11635:364-1059(+)